MIRGAAENARIVSGADRWPPIGARPRMRARRLGDLALTHRRDRGAGAVLVAGGAAGGDAEVDGLLLAKISLWAGLLQQSASSVTSTTESRASGRMKPLPLLARALVIARRIASSGDS